MNFVKILEDLVTSVVTWIVTICAGFFIWIYRNITKNSREITELRAEIATKEALNARDRQDLQELKRSINAIHSELYDFRKDVLELLQNHKE